MPNYVENVLTVDKDSVTKERFMQIAEFVASKEKLFDLNRIVPQPPELNVSDEAKDRAALMEQNRVSYGFADWYGWRCKYWGTKWNVWDISSPDEGFGWEFFTAWEAPIPVISVLSLIFSEVVFTLRYADEDLGHNCGAVMFIGGEEVFETIYPGREEGYDFAANLWGRTLEEVVYGSEKEGGAED